MSNRKKKMVCPAHSQFEAELFSTHMVFIFDSSIVLLQRLGGGAIQHVAIHVETRSVTWTFPHTLSPIELQIAAPMRANWLHRMKGSVEIAVHTDLLQTSVENAAFSRK